MTIDAKLDPDMIVFDEACQYDYSVFDIEARPSVFAKHSVVLQTPQHKPILITWDELPMFEFKHDFTPEKPYDLEAFMNTPLALNTVHRALFINQQTSQIMFLHEVSYRSIIDTIKASVEENEFDVTDWDILYLLDSNFNTITTLNINTPDQDDGTLIEFYSIDL